MSHTMGGASGYSRYSYNTIILVKEINMYARILSCIVKESYRNKGIETNFGSHNKSFLATPSGSIKQVVLDIDTVFKKRL